MTGNKLYLINNFDADPQNDPSWVPEDHNQWFKPCFLDLVNLTYSGYWYSKQKDIENTHYHSGISSGIVLRGEMLLYYNGLQIHIHKNDNFLLLPHTKHSAELLPDDRCFLFFGTVVGLTYYEDSEKRLDVSSYLDLVSEHYLKYKLPFDHLIKK